MLYYYENKEKVLRKQKERECDKKEFNRKQLERYHRKKVEKLLNRFEAMETEVVG